MILFQIQKKDKNLINLLNEHTNEDIPMDQTADFINQFFINIGPQLAAPLNRGWTYDGIVTDETIDVITTNQREIEILSKNIKGDNGREYKTIKSNTS